LTTTKLIMYALMIFFLITHKLSSYIFEDCVLCRGVQELIVYLLQASGSP